jgi:O-antigen/teichoic acid export membrane protein
MVRAGHSVPNRTRRPPLVAEPGWRALIGDVAVFTVAFAITNIASYLYLVLVGRHISLGQFGVVNALFGVISIFSVTSASLQVAVTQATAKCATRPVFDAVLRRTVWLAFWTAAATTIAGLLFADRFGARTAEILVVGAVAFAMLASSAPLGALGALTLVRSQANIILVGTIARLVTAVVLIPVGMTAAGALSGYFMTYVVALLVGYAVVRRRAHEDGQAGRHAPAIRVQPMWFTTVLVTFAPFTLDQLAVQLLLPAAGDAYAALATISKIVFYAAYPVIGVFYPRMVAEHDERQRRRLVGTAAGAVAMLAAIPCLIVTVFPGQTTQLLFGNRYAEATPHVALLSAAVACFALSVLGAHALIAWKSRLSLLPAIVAVAAGIALFITRHSSLADIVENMALTYALQVASTIVVLLLVARTSVRRSSASASA